MRNLKDNYKSNLDTNPCSNNPCLNNAACVVTGTTYFCSCSAGYSGVNCQICKLFSI